MEICRLPGNRLPGLAGVTAVGFRLWRIKMMRGKLFGGLATALVTLVLGQQAQAGPIMGSEAFGGRVTNTVPGGVTGDITTATSVTFSKFSDQGDQGDWNTYFAPDGSDIVGPF